MKIVALNGSPRGMRSGTAVMIEALLEGLSSQGNTTKHIQLSDMTIAHCSGCYTCWSKTPGMCIHEDDMKGIVSQIKDASVLIFGSPLYFNNVSGTLKDFFDRLTASAGDPRNTPDRGQGVGPGYIMVSNCGYPYRSQFDVISLWINRIGALPGFLWVKILRYCNLISCKTSSCTQNCWGFGLRGASQALKSA